MSFLLVFSLPVLAGSFILLALNSAIFWKLLDFINFTQSAGNPLNLSFIGIPRDYTLELICCNIISIYLNKNKIIYYKDLSHLKFSSYLTGLIEGDGSIIVPKTKRSDKGRINYPSIQITFHLKDLPLALIIQKELQNGSLCRKKEVNAYILTINSYEGLLKVTSLLNGNMRTPKINALYKLIDWLNDKFDNVNIPKKSLNNYPLNSNAWLSGFIEADGHFSVRTTKNLKYTRVECKFELTQTQNNHNNNNNLYFMEDIANFLFCSVKAIRIDRPKPEYRLRTINLKGNLVLETYLNNYPLFGS